MSVFFSNLAASFVTIPILGYLVVFVICKTITKNHRVSVRMAIDVSTLLFIISVHYLIIAIWDVSMLWFILLLMLCLGVVVTFIHWKVKEEIVYQKVLRGFWRFNFLIFFVIYTALLIIGIVQRVSLAMS